MFCCARQDFKLKSHLERDTKSTAYLGKINLKLKSYLFDSEYPCAPVSLGANVCMDVLPVMRDGCTSQLALIRFMILASSYKDNLYGDVLV